MKWGLELKDLTDGYYWVKSKDKKSEWVVARYERLSRPVLWLAGCTEDPNDYEIGERIERKEQ